MAVAPEDQDQLRVPLVEETVSIQRRKVETDRVRIRTVVDAKNVLVEEQLRIGRLDVARVAVDREVTETPEPYREGNTLVIPIVEERLVIEKRLFVVEEVRVTDIAREEAVQIPVSLRRTRAVVEREGPEPQETGSN